MPAGGLFISGRRPGLRCPAIEVAAVVDLFRGAGLECQPREDIEAVLWEKLVINVGINPLTALLRVPNGVLLQLPEAWEVAVAAARRSPGGSPGRGVSPSAATPPPASARSAPIRLPTTPPCSRIFWRGGPRKSRP